MYVEMDDRQFLFRESDIGRPKSLTAAKAVSAMNPALNIKPYEAKCSPETEELFSDTFYSGLSVRKRWSRKEKAQSTLLFHSREYHLGRPLGVTFLFCVRFSFSLLFLVSCVRFVLVCSGSFNSSFFFIPCVDCVVMYRTMGKNM